MNKKELWLNLANYHFDHLAPTHFWDEIAAKFGGENPFTKAFADKLSRKLGWKKNFALRAIWEYKKFVYLGVVSDFSVTPSKIIDQVWHEHLLFSAGYRKFCSETIQYNFDHNPELVSVDSQSDAFRSQYLYTIEAYEKEFGHKPPAEIWDTTKFKDAPKKKKIEKEKVYDSSSSDYSSSDSLISMFPGTSSHDVEFGGGDFGGGGSGGHWDASDNDSSGSDSDSGSDSGSSCSSSCGSSCGGGGD